MSVMNKKRSMQSLPFAILYGVGASVIISLIGSVAGASFINAGRIGERGYSYLCSIIWIVATILGCVVAGKVIRDKKYIAGIASGLGYTVILSAVQILFFDSEFSSLRSGIFCIFAGVGLSILLLKGKKRNNKKKYTYKK